MPNLCQVEFILFVQNQTASRDFYKSLLRRDPSLDVEGMTEFELMHNCKLGLMPNRGAGRILSNKALDPASGIGIPRCELYLTVDDVALEYANATDCGARLISPISSRDWGDTVCYFADPDGHIIAFAQRNILSQERVLRSQKSES